MGIGPDRRLVELARELFREVSEQPGVEGAALVGALARNVYAAPRATSDVDIGLLLRDADAYEAVVAGLQKRGYWVQGEYGDEEGSFPSLAQFDGPVHLDLLIAHTEFEKQALKKRRVFRDGGIELAAVSPEDLVVYKLLRFSPQDKADIEAVLQAVIPKGETIDWELVQRYADEFKMGHRVEWARGVARRHGHEQKL
jgi:hypothetical protein